MLERRRDPKTGLFLPTTDSTRYKAVQFNGQRMSEHNRVWCLALNIPRIPKGFYVHHVDGNKRNNDINNLALVTHTLHNRIHAHEPWNKGLTTHSSPKWAETIKKIHEKRNKTLAERKLNKK